VSKRFTDTDKWERPWFRKLPVAYKLLWDFITAKCDLIGVWYVDFEMAEFVIGEKVTPEEALKLFEKQIQVVDESRWLIKDFVVFQYGELKENNNLHRSVGARLRAINSAPQQPLNSPSRGAKVRVKVMEKEKVSLSLGGVGGIEVPEDLKTSEPEIRDWLEYKQQRGESYKPGKGLEALWRAWRAIPPDKRREAVDHSMANNWAGLFQKNGGQYGKSGYEQANGGSGKIPSENPGKFAGIAREIEV